MWKSGEKTLDKNSGERKSLRIIRGEVWVEVVVSMPSNRQSTYHDKRDKSFI